MLGMTFSPLVFDSFGSLGPHSLKTLQKIIAKAVGDNSPQPIQEATYYWQRLWPGLSAVSLFYHLINLFVLSAFHG